jgi:hypothetical protein
VRRAFEAIAQTSNGVDRRVDLKHTETTLRVNWSERSFEVTRRVDTASIAPSEASTRSYTCSGCGRAGHNIPTCPN